jgi:iron complex transport system permease protein
VATHDLDFVRRAAARAVALRQGGIVWQGTPRVVLEPARLRALYEVPSRAGAAFAPPGPVTDEAPARGLHELIPKLPPRPKTSAQEPGGALGGRLRPFSHASPCGGRTDGRRRVPAGALLVLGCAFVLVGAPWVGPRLDAASGLAGSAAEFVLWQLRVPRVLLAATAGGALAVAGAAFQALFRNPLATPYTLGVASGAATGAVVALLLGVGASVAGLTATSLGALAGALGITAAVYGLGRGRRTLPTATLLLAGVTLAFFLSALILLLQYLADFTAAFRILRWLMGEVRIVGYRPLLVVGPLVVAGGGLVLVRRAELNLLLTGEELAAARGVDVERVKRTVFLGTSLAVGAVVSACGPIGFVGLIVPHAVRALLGPDLRRVVPACVPAGAAFLVVCDTVGRIALAPAELPVGVVTALVGGPVFLAVLLRRRAGAG